MEADWALALGADDPKVVVPWEAPGNAAISCRFIPLRSAPHRIDDIAEARAHPALRSALLRLNAPASQIWTAKCDAWATGPESGHAALDPYEMEAEPGTTAFGAGSYIDLLPRKAPVFESFEVQRAWMLAVIGRLHTTPAGAARVELVMRPAEVDHNAGFALTCFVEGCGPTAEQASQRWAKALGLSLAVLLNTPYASSMGNDTMTPTGE